MRPLIMDMVESLLKKGERVVATELEGGNPFDMVIHRVFTRTQKIIDWASPETEFMVLEGEITSLDGVTASYTINTAYSRCEALNLDKIGGVWRIL